MAGDMAPGLATPFAQWSIISRSQIRHYLRTYRFLGLLSFVGLVSAAWLVLLVASGRGIVLLNFLNSDSEFLTDYAQSLPLWIILAAAFFGGDALSVDFHSGTGYYTLVLPVDRGTMLAGRFTSALVLTLAIVAGYDLFGLLGATFAFGPASLPWASLGASFALSVLFAGAALSVAFCFSALFDTTATGVIATILVLFVALTTLQGMVELAGFEPWWSLYYAGGSIANVLDWQFVAHQSIPIGGGQYIQSWSASAPEGAAIMLVYLAVFLGLSLVLYRRRESVG